MFRGVIQRLLLTLQALLDVSITSPGNNDVLAYDSASGLWKNKAGGAGGGVTSLNTETGDITLVAGSNVTITPSGTNITIASTGGSGTPGGSNTQVQYNNSGSFGGITGATTDGTALTMAAPVLGTPASGTLTNTTGFPAASLAGATLASGVTASSLTSVGAQLGVGIASPVFTLQVNDSAYPRFLAKNSTSAGSVGIAMQQLNGNGTSGNNFYTFGVDGNSSDTHGWGLSNNTGNFLFNTFYSSNPHTVWGVTAGTVDVFFNGNITSGTWHGTAVAAGYGGTGIDSSASTGIAQVSSGTWSVSTALASGTTATTQASSDNSTKVATTAYVTTGITNALNGLDWKPAVGYATTANVIGTNTAGVFTYTSTGVDTIDGHTLALNDVVLFKNQTTGADNGVWVVTTAGAIGVAGILTRRSDYNAAADIHDGDTFFVQNGTANAATSWVQTAVVNTINSDALTFSQVAGPGTYTAGNGISITSNAIAIDTSITVDKTTAQTLTNKTLTSPTLTTPALGTPASGVLTNCNGTAASLTAGTATALLNARTIGGTSFDGTANITVATATGGFTVSGGALALGTQNITMTGSLAATGSRVTKGWFTDIESTNAPTIGGTAATGSGGLVRATSPTLVTPLLGTPTSGTLTNCTGLPNASVVGLAASATTDTTNAANISSGTIPSARLGTVGGTYIGDAVTGAQTLTLIQYAPYAMTLTALKNLGTVAGTVTGDLKINGTAVTGGSSLSLTSTPQNPTLTAANSVSIGDVVTFVTSSPSSLTGLLPFTLLATRA